jgi:hypothetical protein
MKVLFHDNWTRGIHNFLPLADELRREGADCLLVHRGSWGSETDRPKEEEIDGLLCRDISFYRTRILYKMLASERPDVVVILNTNFIADRAIVLAGRALGIQTAYLMHGVLETGGEIQEIQKASTERMHSQRWQRVGKYLREVLPNYFWSGSCAQPFFAFRPDPYLLIAKTFLRPEKYVYYPPPSPELQCDHGLVWAKVYARHLSELYGYQPDRLEVVGHPPLDPVFRLLREPPAESKSRAFLADLRLSVEQPFVVFLESPFVEQQFAGWTPAVRDALIEALVESCRQAGRTLVIKLHPSSTFDNRRRSEDPVVRVVRTTDLPLLVLHSELCIAFMSSTVNIPICMRKPVITPAWATSATAPDFFVKHGLMTPIRSKVEMVEALRNPKRLCSNDSDWARYVDEYITLTDGKSVNRIVRSLLRAGRAKKAAR